MCHYGLGIVIIILLIIVALLLAVGILAASFWLLFLLLRESMPPNNKSKKKRKKNYSKKEREENWDLDRIEEMDGESRQNSDSLDSSVIMNYAEKKEDVGYSYHIKAETDKKGMGQASVKKVDPSENLDRMLAFIKAKKSKGVYLKQRQKSNSEKLITDKVMLEETANIQDAFLMIYAREGEKYEILPYNTDIGEGALVYGGVRSCFRLTPEPVRGQNYKITGVKKACRVSRSGNYYYVEEQGELEIQQNKAE